MSPLLALLPLLLPGPSAVRAEEGGGEPCAAVAEVLLASSANDELQRAQLVRELLALGDVQDCLLGALARGATAPPTPGAEAVRLEDGQNALVLAAVLALGRERLATFLDDVRRHPANPVRLAAALRVAGAGPFEPAQLGRLVRHRVRTDAVAEEELVTEAFAPALADLLRRAPQAYAALESWWPDLTSDLAAATMHALTLAGDRQGLRCLAGWLGRRPELDEALIAALGGLAYLAQPEEARELALDLLQLRAPGLERAVVTALGRLQVPESVPFLLERLESPDEPTSRAALAALRLVSGARLTPTARAWQAWHAREEAWWRDVAPERIERLAQAESAGLAVGDVNALARELCEHPLHREELALAFRPALAHSDPAVRVIACQALERLKARSGAQLLFPLLQGGTREVVAAARSALVAITGIEWRGTLESLSRRLAARGFYPQGRGRPRRAYQRQDRPARRPKDGGRTLLAP